MYIYILQMEFLEVPVECILETLKITMTSNNEEFLKRHFTQINGATIGGPASASVTDIFGAVFIDPVAKEGVPLFQEIGNGIGMIHGT